MNVAIIGCEWGLMEIFSLSEAFPDDEGNSCKTTSRNKKIQLWPGLKKFLNDKNILRSPPLMR